MSCFICFGVDIAVVVLPSTRTIEHTNTSTASAMVVALEQWRWSHVYHAPSLPLSIFCPRSNIKCPILSLRCCAVTPRLQVQAPPDDYDFRSETQAQTLEIVKSMYPDLLDLVEDGTLVVVRRPADYVERRSDGYVQPEVVFVVGTAHMSRLSATQVTRVVNSVRPDNLVVELCRSRAGIMYDASPTTDEEEQGAAGKQKQLNLMSLSGANFGSAVSRSLQLGGRSALALRLLLAGMSKRISTSAGVATGEEFRAARKAAEDIGTQIVLGDRPIEITLQRAWAALRWDEQFRLVATLLQAMMASNIDASEETLQALQKDDALSAMFLEISQRFPSLLQPLIHERDMYLAWSLKRSKAVNGCAKVVGVIGRGHLRGVVYALMHDEEHLRFRDLVGVRGSSEEAQKGRQIRNFVKNLLVETAIGSMLWCAWDVFHR